VTADGTQSIPRTPDDGLSGSSSKLRLVRDCHREPDVSPSLNPQCVCVCVCVWYPHQNAPFTWEHLFV